MPEPARDAALVLLTIAYLGGAVLMLVALTKVLLAWSTSWRPDKDADRGDIDGLRQLAAAAMAAVASRASVAAPAVDVVAVLGVPLANGGGPVTGDGGLAVTRFRVGRPPTVMFATAALTGLSPAAVHSLAAHELAHVIRRERSSATGRYVWLAGYLVLMGTGAGLSVIALATSPQLGGLALTATLATAVAFLGLQVAFDRREEIAADLFAVELTHDLDAAAELMRFLDEHVTRPLPDGRLARAGARLERRWFAAHPPAPVRLAAMRRHLAELPGR
ncbi:MAG: M48 family metalloprotease [Nocardioides sp.]|uniref:M48 family metalloprotease n=1 Tax=Nocardioides sp. TaxID=35761 RepID=UPI00239C27BB|nr:M48 family metalloprotease [Nocardioides sp.]MDE0778784.1 M48 family metalloprotease [Nocardioides sp.]